MSTVLVVVIAGVIIAAIAVATLSEDPKPATTTWRPRRGRPPRHLAGPEEPPPPVAEAGPSTPAWDPPRFETAVLVAPNDGEPDQRGLLHRARSALLLAVTVVLLGSLTAGLLGALVVLAARALNRALG